MPCASHGVCQCWDYASLLSARRNPIRGALVGSGIRQAGVDVCLGDFGAAVQEVMESYEVELDSNMHQDNWTSYPGLCTSCVV